MDDFDIVNRAVMSANREAEGIVDGRSVHLMMFKSSRIKMSWFSTREVPVWYIVAQVGSSRFDNETRTFYELADAVSEFIRLKIKYNLVEDYAEV